MQPHMSNTEIEESSRHTKEIAERTATEMKKQIHEVKGGIIS